jgi:hypothetical protein
MLKAMTAIAVVAAAFGGATPALAKKNNNNGPTPTPTPPACAGYMGLFSTPATACQGFFDKNVLSNNSGDEAIQEAAVEALLGAQIPNFEFTDYLKINASNGLIDFDTVLFGDVIIGAHWGGANGQANNTGNATGFFLFKFNQPVGFITTQIPGLSGAVLYANGTPPPPPGVPEPATWGMMLLGFGAAGTALRRSRRKQSQLLQIA